MENIFGMLGIKYKEEIFEENNNVFSGGVIYTSGKNKMAKCGIINNDLCDKIYLTDDNPRTESPKKIRNEIKTKILKSK